jgi:flavodoxin
MAKVLVVYHSLGGATKNHCPRIQVPQGATGLAGFLKN